MVTLLTFFKIVMHAEGIYPHAEQPTSISPPLPHRLEIILQPSLMRDYKGDPYFLYDCFCSSIKISPGAKIIINSAQQLIPEVL